MCSQSPPSSPTKHRLTQPFSERHTRHSALALTKEPVLPDRLESSKDIETAYLLPFPPRRQRCTETRCPTCNCPLAHIAPANMEGDDAREGTRGDEPRRDVNIGGLAKRGEAERGEDGGIEQL